MKYYATFLVLSLLGIGLGFSQVVTKQILIGNGGRFSFNPTPMDFTNLQIYDPGLQTYETLDTVGATSIQDLLIDGSRAYLGAADSVILYDLVEQKRLAAQAYDGESTHTLALSEDYLLVGNFFLPFGSTEPYTRNLMIYNRETLALIDSVPELSLPVKGIVVFGDTAYVNQNFTSSAFADSAGFLAKVSLTDFSVTEVAINQNNEDLGPLFVRDSILFGLNGVSNTILRLDLRDGSFSTDTANANIQPGGYPPLFAFDEMGTFYLKVDNQIATYDLENRNVINPSVIDTVVSAFALDTVQDRIYVTQTDFVTYTGGIIYDLEGNRLDTLLTGFSPEEIRVVYNQLPSVSTIDTGLVVQAGSETLRLKLPVEDADNRQTLITEILTQPMGGQASIDGDSLVYTPDTSFTGQDSLQLLVSDEWGDADTAWIFIQVDVMTSLPSIETVAIAIYPNPTRDWLQLSLSKPWQGKVSLVDLKGRIMAQNQMNGQQSMRWNVNEWPTGIYIIRGEGPEGQWQQRWIKE